jgi:hypothetical protein
MEQLKNEKTTQEALPSDSANDNSYVFLYWDDLGDSHDHVDKQVSPCASHARETEWAEQWNKRINIIKKNGNTDEPPELDRQGV